ncbi:hypothetical protein C5748_02030 [Phyllobacterium phragmitis]|uniref:MipA/OmpV family protein n=1 Tax=Phyllobacterium phragmitis TaxID=2670329 RepID=A0A2S9IZI0_9HYPH|nr:hypothetical protein [Phyllobacterium phragmitis]PRD45937.1 hypothetical protein C5748_02030 [Phyllobacterium phragmitis]
MTIFHHAGIAATAAAVFTLLSLSAQEVQASDIAPVIANPKRTANGAYLMRLGARLPLGWDTSIGTEIGFAGAAQDPHLLGAPAAPPSALWSSVKLPSSSFAGWDGADLNLRLGTEDGSGSIGMSTRRKWTLADSLTAQVNDHYSMWYSGSTTKESHWQTTKAFQLSFDRSRTSFTARTRRTDTDPRWHTSIGAQQKIFGKVNLVTSMNDITADNGTQSFGANYAHKW